MNCESCQKLALLRDSGELSQQQCGALEDHVTACPACREALAQTAELLADLRAARPPLPPALRKRTLQAADTGAGRRRILRLAVAALATAASILIAFALWRQQGPTPTTPAPRSADPALAAVQAEVLPDPAAPPFATEDLNGEVRAVEELLAQLTPTPRAPGSSGPLQNETAVMLEAFEAFAAELEQIGPTQGI